MKNQNLLLIEVLWLVTRKKTKISSHSQQSVFGVMQLLMLVLMISQNKIQSKSNRLFKNCLTLSEKCFWSEDRWLLKNSNKIIHKDYKSLITTIMKINLLMLAKRTLISMNLNSWLLTLAILRKINLMSFLMFLKIHYFQLRCMKLKSLIVSGHSFNVFGIWDLNKLPPFKLNFVKNWKNFWIWFKKKTWNLCSTFLLTSISSE